EKLAVLLVEQNATMALAVAHHGYVMENGRIVLEGSVEALRANSDIREFYLGLNEIGSRKCYGDCKHYKRRKHWLSYRARLVAGPATDCSASLRTPWAIAPRAGPRRRLEG